MTGQKITPRHKPCSTCPYRTDVPSGIWAETEYEKQHRRGSPGQRPSAKSGMAQYVVPAPEGQVCHCLARDVAHIHRIEPA